MNAPLSTITIAAPDTDTEGSAALTVRLTEWIKADGLTGHYPADGIASRVIASSGPEYVTRCLDAGGTNYLRGLCASIKTDLDDAEAWAEDMRHGHLIEDLAAGK